MHTSISPEALAEELYAVYGYTVSPDYAMNYIEMNEYATVDDFHCWLQDLG
jgi:hypothetical protein